MHEGPAANICLLAGRGKEEMRHISKKQGSALMRGPGTLGGPGKSDLTKEGWPASHACHGFCPTIKQLCQLQSQRSLLSQLLPAAADGLNSQGDIIPDLDVSSLVDYRQYGCTQGPSAFKSSA